MAMKLLPVALQAKTIPNYSQQIKEGDQRSHLKSPPSLFGVMEASHPFENMAPRMYIFCKQPFLFFSFFKDAFIAKQWLEN